MAVVVAMEDQIIVDMFADLFDGNPFYIGTEEGGCSENIQERLRPLLEWHLTGERGPFGVYPIYNNEVKWGCIDFDDGDEDSLIHATNISLALQEFGIVGHIERSRSKGFHVWVFGASWVVAKLMREALLAVCQLVDAPTKEVNPKQSALVEGQVGNYVRLPYPGALSHRENAFPPDARRVVIEPKSQLPYPVRGFVANATEYQASCEQLEELASFYAAEKREPVVYTLPSQSYTGDAQSRMRPLTKWIFNHGPTDRSDRSSALWKFACLLAEDGRHSHEEALGLLTDADARWGKFMPRSDGELRLEELLDKAWRDRATHYSPEGSSVRMNRTNEAGV